MCFVVTFTKMAIRVLEIQHTKSKQAHHCNKTQSNGLFQFATAHHFANKKST